MAYNADMGYIEPLFTTIGAVGQFVSSVAINAVDDANIVTLGGLFVVLTIGVAVYAKAKHFM